MNNKLELKERKSEIVEHLVGILEVKLRNREEVYDYLIYLNVLNKDKTLSKEYLDNLPYELEQELMEELNYA